MKTRIGTILAIGDDGVDEGGLLDAAQDHEVEEPDADRGDDDRDDGVAVAEDRKEARRAST